MYYVYSVTTLADFLESMGFMKAPSKTSEILSDWDTYARLHGHDEGGVPLHVPVILCQGCFIGTRFFEAPKVWSVLFRCPFTYKGGSTFWTSLRDRLVPDCKRTLGILVASVEGFTALGLSRDEFARASLFGAVNPCRFSHPFPITIHGSRIFTAWIGGAS